VADVFSPDERSRIMARIKGRDTRPELMLRRALWALGVRGWRCHRRDLPGRPDISFGRVKLAVFVDGAFWHGHPSKFKAGQSGEFWDRKIAQNAARDRRVDTELSAQGWTVLRVWDFDVLADPVAEATRIQEIAYRGVV
jgi:DNA mismatch endonuclease (patch repair protein)